MSAFFRGYSATGLEIFSASARWHEISAVTTRWDGGVSIKNSADTYCTSVNFYNSADMSKVSSRSSRVTCLVRSTWLLTFNFCLIEFKSVTQCTTWSHSKRRKGHWLFIHMETLHKKIWVGIMRTTKPHVCSVTCVDNITALACLVQQKKVIKMSWTSHYTKTLLDMNTGPKHTETSVGFTHLSV